MHYTGATITLESLYASQVLAEGRGDKHTIRTTPTFNEMFFQSTGKSGAFFLPVYRAARLQTDRCTSDETIP